MKKNTTKDASPEAVIAEVPGIPAWASTLLNAVLTSGIAGLIKPQTAPKDERIHPAMVAILQDIEAIKKDQRNEAQKFRFRGIDDVYNHLHPIFASHGVIVLQMVDGVDSQKWERVGRDGNAAGHTFYSKVYVRYRFTAMDGSYVEAKAAGEAMDTGDKSLPKALSMAHKSMLLQTFLIPTADIEDADMDPTADPRAELERQEAALQAKREAVRQNIAAETEPVGEAIEGKPLRPVDPPAEKAKPETEKPAPKPKAEKAAPPAAESAEVEPFWKAYRIKVIKLSSIKGKPLGELSPEQITQIKTAWADSITPRLDSATKDQREEYDAIMAAFAAL